MRTPTIVAIAGAIALAVAWLLLSRTQPPAAPARPPVAVVAPAVVPAAPMPAATAVASTEPAPVAPATPPAEPPPAISPESPRKPETVTKDEPPAAGDEDADSAETPADDDTASADDSGPKPIDSDHSTDLMADWIAKQEAEGADDPDKVDRALKTFDDESAGDPNWSESTEKKIQAVLDEWLAGLPAEIRQHVDLIRLECRITLCQILAADNDAATLDEREQHAQEWQQAIALLPQQPWWHELGFVDLTTTMRMDPDSGYLLYQTYLIREATPAEQTTPAAP